MKQPNPQSSISTTRTASPANRAQANDPRSEAAPRHVAPDEQPVGLPESTRLAAILGLHAVLKTYMAFGAAPTLAFPRLAPPPRGVRGPSGRSPRADRKTAEAQPTSAVSASDTAAAGYADGPRRSKPSPPHGFRHSVLARAPDRSLTAIEVKRLIRHFGTEYVEAILQQSKR